MPINICHITQSAGGVETYILNILQFCNPKRFRHSIICYENGTLAQEARSLGVEVILVPMMRQFCLSQDLSTMVKVISELRRDLPDVIHCHSGKGGIYGRLAGTILGIPVVFTPHAFSYLGQKGVKKDFILLVEKLMAFTPCLLVGSSPSESKRAIAEVGWKPRKVTDKFPNSVVVGKRIVHHRKKEKIKVLMIGRLSYQKNPEMLLRVARKVKKQHRDISFTIMGAGYGDELGPSFLTLCEELYVESIVQIIKWASKDEVEKELLGSDIYISTSRYESFGFVTAEAMAMGLPVIATKVDGSIDLVEDGKTGFLVNIDDDNEMANNIITLSNEPVLRQKMGTSGRKRVYRYYDITKNIKEVEKIYYNISITANIY
jgi:glycosyltransferase involved in cell wall biosynthesis